MVLSVELFVCENGVKAVCENGVKAVCENGVKAVCENGVKATMPSEKFIIKLPSAHIHDI